jgi:hypothetical protein
MPTEVEEALWKEYYHIAPYLEQEDDNVDITWFETPNTTKQ